jgi:hypothetical protein
VQELEASRDLHLATINTPVEKPRHLVRLLGKLGEGAFGIVHKALMDERTTQGVPSYLVAVKEVKDPNEEMRQEVYWEATVMAQISHPHVVQLVRACVCACVCVCVSFGCVSRHFVELLTGPGRRGDKG